MASDNTIRPPDTDADSAAVSNVTRKIIFLLEGRYDADPRPGYDPRDDSDPDYIDPETLSKKKSWSFPVKFWNYDGRETIPTPDEQKTPENAHSTSEIINEDDYAFSVLTRERTSKRAFAVFAFQGYDQTTGEIKKSLLMDLSNDEPKVSRDGVETPSPIVNQAMFDELLHEAIPRGIIWPTLLTRNEILALWGGTAHAGNCGVGDAGHHWVPLDGGTYKSWDGSTVTVKNVFDKTLMQVASLALEGTTLGQLTGSNTLNWQHNHSGHRHAHDIGSISLTISSMSASGTGTLPVHTHTVAAHQHDATHGHSANSSYDDESADQESADPVPGSTFNLSKSTHYHATPSQTLTTGSPVNGSSGNPTLQTGNGGGVSMSITGIGGTGNAQIASGAATGFDPVGAGTFSTGVTSTTAAPTATQDIRNSHMKVWFMYKL